MSLSSPGPDRQNSQQNQANSPNDLIILSNQAIAPTSLNSLVNLSSSTVPDRRDALFDIESPPLALLELHVERCSPEDALARSALLGALRSFRDSRGEDCVADSSFVRRSDVNLSTSFEPLKDKHGVTVLLAEVTTSSSFSGRRWCIPNLSLLAERASGAAAVTPWNGGEEIAAPLRLFFQWDEVQSAWLPLLQVDSGSAIEPLIGNLQSALRNELEDHNAGSTQKQVKDKYPSYLLDVIEEKLASTLSDQVDFTASGWTADSMRTKGFCGISDFEVLSPWQESPDGSTRAMKGSYIIRIISRLPPDGGDILSPSDAFVVDFEIGVDRRNVVALRTMRAERLPFSSL